MLSCGVVGPCGYEDKGGISLQVGGKGVYIHTASMTHISCLSEHSLFKSLTWREHLTDTNLTTMTCLMLKPMIPETEEFLLNLTNKQANIDETHYPYSNEHFCLVAIQIQ